MDDIYIKVKNERDKMVHQNVRVRPTVLILSHLFEIHPAETPFVKDPPE